MSNKVYIGNLPYNISEQDIESVFVQFGTIEDISLIRDRGTGKLKGFGFIAFESQKSAQDALQMDGKDFHGRAIKVSLAKERTSGGAGGGARHSKRW
jgi:cold-inducible RNA-binding protein